MTIKSFDRKNTACDRDYPAIATTAPFVPNLIPARTARLDLLGTALVTCGLGLVAYGLLQGPGFGWDRKILIMLAAGIVALAGFLWYERTLGSRALMPALLFQNRNFAIMTLVGVAVSFGLVGLALPLSLYLQYAVGLSALQAGLRMAPAALAMMPAFGAFGALVGKLGGRLVLILGLTAYTACLLTFAITAHSGQTGAPLVSEIIFAGIAQAAIFTPLMTLAIHNIPAEQLGAASGTLIAIRQIGYLLAIASVGAFLDASHTRHELQTLMLPAVAMCAAIMIAAAVICLRLVEPRDHPTRDATAFL